MLSGDRQGALLCVEMRCLEGLVAQPSAWHVKLNLPTITRRLFPSTEHGARESEYKVSRLLTAEVRACDIR